MRRQIEAAPPDLVERIGAHVMGSLVDAAEQALLDAAGPEARSTSLFLAARGTARGARTDGYRDKDG